MSQSYLLATFLAISGLTASSGASVQERNTLELSCLHRPFISFFASSPARDAFPAVELTLTDPLGRTVGHGTKNDAIPASSYGPIVEIPDLPLQSKAVALELCNAEQGTYEVTVTERGNERYRLGVRGDGNTANDATLLLHHISEKGRIRRYRFVFRIEKRALTVRWLDKDDKEQWRIEDREW